MFSREKTMLVYLPEMSSSFLRFCWFALSSTWTFPRIWFSIEPPQFHRISQFRCSFLLNLWVLSLWKPRLISTHWFLVLPVSLRYNRFIRWFHQLVFTIFSQFEQLKNKINFLLVHLGVSSQSASWKINQNKFVDSEFKIGETIWWIC